MKRTILLCLLLCGCATATKLNTGDGAIYRVECNGAALTETACYKKANATCPTAWDQIGADGQVIPQGTVTKDFGVIGAVVYRSITVKCR
jgi:hypothetical protein